MMKLIAFCLLWLASFSSQAFESGSITRVSDAVLRIEGVLTPAVSRRFYELIDDKVKLIQISSEGGVTESGLEIAEEIQRRSLDIEIEDFCASSCANYLFIAGNRKFIKSGAIIGWHGGHSFTPFRPGLDSQVRLEEKKIILQREQLLYAKAGVSVDLIVYSGILTVGALKEGLVRRDYTLWCPSVAELERLGVKNIVSSGSWGGSREIEERLNALGYLGQSVYVGKAYSYIPEAFLIEKR
ncbi:hypothetical protein H5407_05405 [Mitsuaria sp. WAJ17]|uniref:hypothetical protein n=1 Tax=Mitsuaria sp. WAJ17 TaxID=2761452 RepID=UPI001600C3FE|nr:hypothetical protein [Mitsuaria sp. WAJ17]MBB2484659.1 hypothetical protein [Mitsuaria sp. WAJ17]